MPLIRDALSAIGAIGRFALLGALSGSVATTLIQLLPKSQFQPFAWLTLSPFGLLPGLVFGLIIGAALYRGGHAGPRAFAAYAAASTVSYLAAFNLAVAIADGLGTLWLTGIVAGLLGSACLTALAAWMFAFVRRRKPVLLMLFAGSVLGALLPLSDSFWGAMVFFAAWQAGYAAAFATALPEDA
jgi:hypothetical protein